MLVERVTKLLFSKRRRTLSVICTWKPDSDVPRVTEISTGAVHFGLRPKSHTFFYNRARYHNPQTGRYISSDPISLIGGLNTYTYFQNSPLLFTYPTGNAVTLLEQFIGELAEVTDIFEPLAYALPVIGAGDLRLAEPNLMESARFAVAHRAPADAGTPSIASESVSELA